MIAILLSTFNSSKYLREQLDSLLNQTYKNWELYIRDDGSTDQTHEIIAYYCQNNANFFWLKDQVKARGAKNSFMWLLEQVQSDYYMFCDHDDIWLPDKIEISFSEMKKLEASFPDTPILINTDLIVVDSELKEIAQSFWEYTKLNQKVLSNYNYLCAANSVTGCTALFNKPIKDIALPMVEDAIMHDWWVALFATKYGIRSYLNRPTVLYRQHEMNIFGAKQILENKNYLLMKLKTATRIIKANMAAYHMMKAFDNQNLLKFFFYKFFYLLRR